MNITKKKKENFFYKIAASIYLETLDLSDFGFDDQEFKYLLQYLTNSNVKLAVSKYRHYLIEGKFKLMCQIQNRNSNNCSSAKSKLKVYEIHIEELYKSDLYKSIMESSETEDLRSMILNNISTLNLRGNTITDIDYLADFFKKVKCIDLSNNDIKGSLEINRFDYLTELTLDINPSYEDAKIIQRKDQLDPLRLNGKTYGYIKIASLTKGNSSNRDSVTLLLKYFLKKLPCYDLDLDELLANTPPPPFCNEEKLHTQKLKR